MVCSGARCFVRISFLSVGGGYRILEIVLSLFDDGMFVAKSCLCK